MYAIEAIELAKNFGQVRAVNGINFQVNEGEVFGFLGPNGAGKTTTIRMLTGQVKPSGGMAKIFGHDIQTDTYEAKRNMGIVPEHSNVYDDLSAWDNIMFTAELYQVPKARREKRAMELLELFGLSGRRKGKIKGFSKGMKRRLTIAMGLINDPKILFLDEPTAGLDVQSSLLIKDVIRELIKNGVTIFLTTHNIEEANIWCDRVAIIQKGRILTTDTPEALKKTTQSVQSVEVAFSNSFANGALELLKELQKIPTVSEVTKEGDKFRLYTAEPPTVLSSLYEFSMLKGLNILNVNTLGPSLEDVFVRLTGIKIRPEEGNSNE